VRWDDLFADLEAQADALAVAERAGAVEERTRIELGGIGLGDRLRAAVGTPVQVQLVGGLATSGTLHRVGVDWLLLDEDAGRETLVCLNAVVSVGGLGRAAAVPGSAGAVHARLSLRSALRGVARDRSPVRLHLVDGTTLDTTLDRVGADFVDLALHAPGEARRRTEVRGVRTVPLSAIAAVRRGA
jgi:ATP phosphoribosyltransferase regulatory subunit HisZ